jgi:excinuclease ABC subunit B
MGDQPAAIAKLVQSFRAGNKDQTLLGVTGSGKTFTMANVIAQLDRPVLIISHNKTLAAQLYSEFKGFFPDNAVEYFVSYYDYYQPEAYVPSSDTFIEKDSSINEEIERLRIATTSSLVSRRDVIVVASVSCIYGLGSPEDFSAMRIALARGGSFNRNKFLERLVENLYERNDYELKRGAFRVRGDTVDVMPAYLEHGLRVEFFGDEIEALTEFEPVSGAVLRKIEQFDLYPANQYVTTKGRLDHAIAAIKAELDDRVGLLREKPTIPRGPADPDADELRPRDAAGDGLLQRHRELLGAPHRPEARRPAVLFDRFLPEGLSADGGREPREHPADRRHV